MLTYTFTRREKALLLVLALMVLLIVWFVFVYQGTTNEITRIEGEIGDTKMMVEADQTRVNQLSNMRATVEQRKAEGAVPKSMPEYDNIRLVMAELNNTMAKAKTYTLTFDDLVFEETHVVRGVRVDYTSNNYKGAEAIVRALAEGAYPCRIDSVTMDTSAKVRSAVSDRTVVSKEMKTSAHVTFFEKYPEGYVAPGTATEKK